MDESELFVSLRQVPTSYENFNIDKVDSNSPHVFKDILLHSKCKLPYYLVTRQCAQRDESEVFASGDESVDGSPLKLQEFDIPQTFVNEKGQAYSAVPVTEARRIISQYTSGLQRGEEELEEQLPMWVLCEDSLSNSTIALGLDIENCDGERSVSTFVATVQGPMDKSSMVPSTNMAHIMRLHGAVNGRNVHQHCKASYSVCRPISTNISGFGELGSLVIDLERKKCSSLLQIPPPDAVCHVNAAVGNGDIRSPAHFMFIELSMIQRIANGIHNNNMEWEVCEQDQETVPIQKQVNELINNAKIVSITSERDHPKEETVTSPLKNVFLVQRKNMDFTEQLWNILKHCGSYNELHDSLHSVLTSLQQGAYQPVLHRANKTKLAGLIRDSFSKKMVMPNLSGLFPLELLLEIGIGKIQRDYSNQMISKELVTAANLEYFLVHDVDMFEKCCRLTKLHTVLELVVMLEQYLVLPSETLRSAARKALAQVAKNDAPESTFNIPVSARCLGNQLSELHPTTWSLCLEASGVHCVYYLSPTCPLKHVMSPGTTEHENIVESEDKPKYMLTVVREHKLIC